MSNPEDRLTALGLKLPIPAAPLAAYVPVMRSGNLLFVSGQLSADANGIISGVSGENIELERAQIAARQSALGVLAQIVHGAKVELENIEQVIKLSIFVAATPQYSEHHLVANGASQLIADVLGDKGKHARAAFGVASLPMGAAVEVEAIVEVSK
jgi:enamine deaminase RidA (YjgF/YER057c/UK114 family)